MLAPMAVFLLVLLITCTIALLICWAYDNDGVENEAARPRPVVLKFPVHRHRNRLPRFGPTLPYPPGGRGRVS
jgi:hypothetical protein